MGGGRHGKGPRTPEPSLRGAELGSRGEDVRGAVARICQDAARLLQEGQAARAYSGLVSASRSLPMTPQLAAVLVRCALKAGTERAVITLLDAAMVTERGEVRREVRRQLSRVLRRTGQEARAAAVLNGLLMDSPDDARARFVLDVLRERVAKAKPAPRLPVEDEESRTKTVEVSALALSDPELGNTVVEMPVVAVPAPQAWAPRAATVQVPLGEWAEPARMASRGPEFPWDDDGPGKARVVTPPQVAKTVPEPVVVAQESGEKVRHEVAVQAPGDLAPSGSGAASSVDKAPQVESASGEAAADAPAPVVTPVSASPSATVPEHVIAALSALMLSGAAKAPERVETASSSAENPPASEHAGGTSPAGSTPPPPDTSAGPDAVRTPDEKVEAPTPAAAPPAPPLFESTQVFGKKLEEALPADVAGAVDEKPEPSKDSGPDESRSPVAVLVPGAPSKAFEEDESTSEILPPPPSEPVAGAQVTASREDASASKPPDADEATSEVNPPRPPSAVLVPGAPAMAFDDEESTSEIIPPERVEAEQGASASTQSRDGKPSAPRRASVLVPSTAKPAFDAEEATSEVVFPQVDSAAKADTAASDAPASARTPDEGSERAQSQRQEAQLIARSAWRELAQLYLKRADRAKDAPERAEALTRLAEVMENELQDSAGAARMYREIVELTGERTALREQVRLLSQREDASLVRRALDDAISRARTSRARAVALLTRGERQLNMGNPAKAREDFESADALVPGMLPVLAGLVRSVSDDERFAQVERLRAACAAAPRRAPDRLEALRVLARTAEESLGDLRIAQWAWAEVLAESPDNEQPREHLLALARRLGDLPALSALLHAQLAREPRGPAARKAHLERVATLEAMGDAGAALAELRQAVRFEPGHKEAWLLLADRCTEREQFGEAAWALENAATATEDDEERQHTWERLALFCREVLHNTEKARLYARRAESLRKSREQRARPPSQEPARPAPAQAVGVPPPSVLVAPPVATGRVPAAKRKDLSDEVTSNTDVPSLLQAEEASSANAQEKRSPGVSATARKGRGNTAGEELDAAPGNKKRGRAGARSDTAERAPRKQSERGTGATPAAPQPGKAPSGRHASVGDTAQGAEAPRRPASGKAPVGGPAALADTVPGAEVDLPAKAPSGRHAPVDAASSSTEAPRQPKAPSGRHASVGTAPFPSEATRQPKAPSGSHAPIGTAAPGTAAVRQPKVPSGRHPSVASTSPEAEPPRRAAKAPAESPVSLAESAPAPSGMARAAKPSRGGPVQDPGPAPDDATSAPDRKQRAAATPPRERTTAFGAALPPDAEPEAPASRKAATASEDNARPSKNAGTQIREAASRVERAPRAGHAPRLPLSASGVEPPPPPRAPLSASGVEPPAPAPRAMAGASRPVAPPSKGRGAPEAPPDIPLLSQIPSEDEDEDAQELGAGPVEATSVIAWEAPPGRMDPVRRIHRAGRPEGTVSGPAPTRPPQASGRPTVGSTETRETPAAVPDAEPPADSTSAEPLVFKLVRERPLDPKPYRGLVDHFDQRGDATRAALMRELADALEGRDVSSPRVQRAPLTNQERAGLRHPGLRTPSGELLACVGIALCRLFPSPARIASTTEPLRATSGPGAAAVLDALNGAARLLGVPLPELVAGDDDSANITPLHTTAPRLVVGRILVQQPPTNAELRFHAGRALFSLSPDLLALRALRKDHLLRALALLSSVLKNPKDAGDDARVVRESLSPRALERAALLMEPGTRDFDASLLVAAARDSANRAGLVACGGPGPALTVLRARRPHDSELEEMVRFAASERYLALRDAAEAGRGR
ncbi:MULTISPECIES: hypothetical protein [unclassified Corallococcus]|uniref:hypothetical protein n=1 Tax=unclassified Corallococcus TaxID=2685029 RepID=UPI001A8EBF82|nr:MULTISPECIES: hypothetical protein [unclassified Corallococcus]MBN9687879.1 hypothetical protein [Corallococcus sp. NCSPR001]WAS88308.1 hypothetical protein O0N60_15290 [Corallococcus sp. NCRR]